MQLESSNDASLFGPTGRALHLASTCTLRTVSATVNCTSINEKAEYKAGAVLAQSGAVERT